MGGGGKPKQKKKAKKPGQETNTNKQNQTRINQDKRDRTEDAVSHVTGTDLGTETGHSPETDVLPQWHRGQLINRI